MNTRIDVYRQFSTFCAFRVPSGLIRALLTPFKRHYFERPVFSLSLSLSLSLLAVVVVVLLFNVHGKHLRSCRDGQLT